MSTRLPMSWSGERIWRCNNSPEPERRKAQWTRNWQASEAWDGARRLQNSNVEIVTEWKSQYLLDFSYIGFTLLHLVRKSYLPFNRNRARNIFSESRKKRFVVMWKSEANCQTETRSPDKRVGFVFKNVTCTCAESCAENVVWCLNFCALFQQRIYSTAFIRSDQFCSSSLIKDVLQQIMTTSFQR